MYFAHLSSLEKSEESILDNLSLYINDIKYLIKDFKARFKDQNKEIPERIIFPFHIEVESANLDTFLKEFIELTFNLEAKSMPTLKGSCNCCVHFTRFSKFVYSGIWV